jgi:hypothetical protein
MSIGPRENSKRTRLLALASPGNNHLIQDWRRDIPSDIIAVHIQNIKCGRATKAAEEYTSINCSPGNVVFLTDICR